MTQASLLNIGTAAPTNERPAHNGDVKLAARLREMAAKLDDEIQRKRDTHKGASPTRKRLSEMAQANADADNMERVQAVLLALAQRHESGQVPHCMAFVRFRKTVELLVYDARHFARHCRYSFQQQLAKHVPTAVYPEAVEWVTAVLADAETAALQQKIQQRIRMLEAEALMSGYRDYFPTPRLVADLLLDCIVPLAGDVILEPSAGAGNLADAIRERFPAARLVCIEQVPGLVEILKLKGHAVLEEGDFLQFDRDPVNWIVMNPPFSGGQDMVHVRHAYDVLEPGGRLVSVMSPGPFFRNDKAAREFREWFDEVSGEKYDLPRSSFAESGTNVHAIYVVIDKGA